MNRPSEPDARTGGDDRLVFPPVETLLRHRPPALLIERIEALAGQEVVCLSRALPDLPWWALLDGCAQGCGVWAGLHPAAMGRLRVVAAYDRIIFHEPRAPERVRFRARLLRPLLDMRQFQARAERLDGQPLVEALVTLSPAPG